MTLIRKNDFPSARLVPKFLTEIPEWESQQCKARLNSRHCTKCATKTIERNPRYNTIRKAKSEQLFYCINKDEDFIRDGIIGIED